MNETTQYYAGKLKPKKTNSLRLTQREKKYIVTKFGTTALCLMEYYLSAVVRKGYVITDEKTSRATGLTLRQVQDNRRLLVRENMFFVIKTKNKDTIVYLYCILKEGVYCMKYFNSLFNCKTVAEVYRKYSFGEIKKVIDKSGLNAAQKNDIIDLLSDYSKKKMFS